jgi:formylglycine-generating enzyme required for sulfatase activity/serine/threonine protein kinase
MTTETENFSEQVYKPNHTKRTVQCEFYLLTQIHQTPYTEVWVVADENAIKRSPNYTGNNAVVLRQSPRFQFILKVFALDSNDLYENEKAALKKLDLFELKHLVKLETTADRGQVIESRLCPITDEYMDMPSPGSDAFIVTKLIDGVSLSEHSKKWSAEKLLALLPQFKNVMNELDSHNIIHRDISPNNLLLDASNHLYLIDFASSKHSTHQVELCGKGTLGYRSPEVRLLLEQVDTSTDLFSMAAVFYCLLTRQAEMPEFLTMIDLTDEDLAKHSQKNQQIQKSISQTLKVVSASKGTIEVFLKALNPDPKLRFASIDAFFSSFTHALKQMVQQQSEWGPLELDRRAYDDELKGCELKIKRLTALLHEVTPLHEQLNLLQPHGVVKTSTITVMSKASALIERLRQALTGQEQRITLLNGVIGEYDRAIDALQMGYHYAKPEKVSALAGSVQDITDDGEVLLIDLQRANLSAISEFKKRVAEILSVNNNESNTALEQAEVTLNALQRFIKGVNHKVSLQAAEVMNAAIGQAQLVEKAIVNAKEHSRLSSVFTGNVQLLSENLQREGIDSDTLKQLIEHYQQCLTEKNQHEHAKLQARLTLEQLVLQPSSQEGYWQAALNNTKSYKKTKVALGLLLAFGGGLLINSLSPSYTQQSEGELFGDIKVQSTHNFEYEKPQVSAFLLPEPSSEQTEVNQLVDKKVLLGKQQFTLKAIPAGSFMMGCSPKDTECDDDEWLDKEKRTQLAVNISAFYMMETEVSVGLFKEFVNATNYRTLAEQKDLSVKGCHIQNPEGGWGYQEGVNWRNVSFKGKSQDDNHPVVCVAHQDILSFIDWLNQQSGQSFRLPSESEWEYAARAETSTPYAMVNKPEDMCGYGNVADQTSHGDGEVWSKGFECNDNYVFTAPVKAQDFKANHFGLYQMYGNVWELTQDCWNGSLVNTPSSGTAATLGDCSRSVLRGGAWVSPPRSLRASYRDRFPRTDRGYSLGFRLAQDSR